MGSSGERLMERVEQRRCSSGYTLAQVICSHSRVCPYTCMSTCYEHAKRCWGTGCKLAKVLKWVCSLLLLLQYS